jgi:hypothetical protein
VVKTQGKAELWLLGQTFYYIEEGPFGSAFLKK